MAQHEPEVEIPQAEAPPAESFQGGVDFQSGADFQQGTSFEAPIVEQTYQSEQYPAQSYQDQSYQQPDQGYQQEQGVDQFQPPQDIQFDGGQSFESPEATDYAHSNYQVPEPEGEVPAVTDENLPATYEQPIQQEENLEPYDFSQPLDAVNTPEPMAPMTSDTPDFSDVTEFANANASAGPLAYTVTIEGIESSLLLSQLREAMTDSRFAWDVADLLSHVGGGKLVLRSLAPAKASVLISRIKYLPFKISWRQDVLSGS